TVDQAGQYKVEFQVEGNEDLWLNRIWIEKAKDARQARVSGQEKPLLIEQSNPKLYLFTTYQEYEGTKVSANALYLLTKEGALRFDPPWHSAQYQLLLDSIEEKHALPVIGVYATHSREDRAGAFGY